jgi:hypothetical protein
MKNTLKAAALPTLADLEREVVAEYRELGRQELARRLQTAAFGGQRTARPTMRVVKCGRGIAPFFIKSVFVFFFLS